MKTYINLKEYEYDIEVLQKKDLWSVDELLEKIMDMQETIEELQDENEDLKNDIETLREHTRPLTNFEEYGIRQSDFV